jgi:hypothetical protein
MADKEDGVKRLQKYMKLQSEYDTPDFYSSMSKTKDAIRQANIAEGKGAVPINDLYVSDEAQGRLTKTGKEVMAKERQRVDELADQYKRETRGMKKGGKVRTASQRADGIAIRGKTRA